MNFFYNLYFNPTSIMNIDKDSNIMIDNASHCWSLKSYDEMKKYCFMAIENENSMAMANLVYYYTVGEEKDYELKYYLMAIEHDHYNSTQLLDECNKFEKHTK